MNHTEQLTRYTANFIDELVCSGLHHVVISPGSRSTPLAMLIREHQEMKEWILVDERSAAFFALGMAKKHKSPVALVCTSGTAAANYFPAIVEARYGRIPLVVLTADRPHELRGVGAPQTIEQIHLYGNYVKDFQEMALPESSNAMLKYVRQRASRAVRIAKEGTQGPVHINFPLREPLVPDFTLENMWGRQDKPYNNYHAGEKRLNRQQMEQLAMELAGRKKGLIVCGPQVDGALTALLYQLCETLQVPLLADPTSQCRAGAGNKDNIIANYDAILKDKTMRTGLRPDYILRFGAMPVSKSYLFFIKEHEDCIQYVVEPEDAIREPTNHRSNYLLSESKELCKDLLLELAPKQTEASWLRRWQGYERVAAQIVTLDEGIDLTEGEAVKVVCQHLPDKSDLFVANSMPVRDLDTFFMPTEKEVFVHANRGASGIDGITSSALGVAAATGERVTLIIGDLSFYHDLNGLLAAKQYELDMTIVLINNNGGGIFSFLPQANEEKHFEALYGTPLHIDFEKAVTMYGGNFTRVTEKSVLMDALGQSYLTKGLSVIEVCTERRENKAWHLKLWEKVKQGLIIHDQKQHTADWEK